VLCPTKLLKNEDMATTHLTSKVRSHSPRLRVPALRQSPKLILWRLGRFQIHTRSLARFQAFLAENPQDEDADPRLIVDLLLDNMNESARKAEEEAEERVRRFPFRSPTSRPPPDLRADPPLAPLRFRLDEQKLARKAKASAAKLARLEKKAKKASEPKAEDAPAAASKPAVVSVESKPADGKRKGAKKEKLSRKEKKRLNKEKAAAGSKEVKVRPIVALLWHPRRADTLSLGHRIRRPTCQPLPPLSRLRPPRRRHVKRPRRRARALGPSRLRHLPQQRCRRRQRRRPSARASADGMPPRCNLAAFAKTRKKAK
jgi:hypothetical protein